MHIALVLVFFLACSACSDAQRGEYTRATSPMFKGVELYSWQDPATRSWRFALLPGTNRSKTSEEIKGATEVIGSVAMLEEYLSRLASGESVSDSEAFALPPAAVSNDIVKHAAASGVTVHLTGAR